MKKTILCAAVVGACFAAASTAPAAIQYGQGVTNAYFNGSGIPNTNFTTDRVGSIELGLQAKSPLSDSDGRHQ